MAADEPARTAPPPNLASPVTTKPLKTAAWIVCSPDREAVGRTLSLESSAGIRIARAEGADGEEPCLIADPWMSVPHFELGPGPAQGPWLVRDLESSSRTIVNGEAVSRCSVVAGDVIRAGATVFVIGAGAVPEDDLGLLGWSAQLAGVRRQVRQAAASRWPLHVTGESGTGKEVVAMALHRASGRSGVFHPLNVANLVPSLVESQLFGHRRGAFSGADSPVTGAFDSADGGTLLLDEIGELPLHLQPKLLRVVEDGRVQRLGDSSAHDVDTRIVTATLADLQRMVEQGTFRADLYYRLVHSRIEVAPLRERPLDVAVLARAFLHAEGVANELLTAGAGAWAWAAALESLLLYSWPGNARELRGEMERVAAACRAHGSLLGREEMLSSHVVDHGRAPLLAADSIGRSPEELVALLGEPEALLAAVRDDAGGSLRGWARQHAGSLGISVEALRRRLRRVLSPDQLAALRADVPSDEG